MLCCTGGLRADKAPNAQSPASIEVINRQPMQHPGMMANRLPMHYRQSTPPPHHPTINQRRSFWPSVLGHNNTMGNLSRFTTDTRDTNTCSLRTSVLQLPSLSGRSASMSRGYTTGGMSITGAMNPVPGANSNPQTALHVPPLLAGAGKISVSIDIGTTSSGVVSLLLCFAGAILTPFRLLGHPTLQAAEFNKFFNGQAHSATSVGSQHVCSTTNTAESSAGGWKPRLVVLHAASPRFNLQKNAPPTPGSIRCECKSLRDPPAQLADCMQGSNCFSRQTTRTMTRSTRAYLYCPYVPYPSQKLQPIKTSVDSVAKSPGT